MEKGNEILEGINEYHTLLFWGYLNYTFFLAYERNGVMTRRVDRRRQKEIGVDLGVGVEQGKNRKGERVDKERRFANWGNGGEGEGDRNGEDLDEVRRSEI